MKNVLNKMCHYLIEKNTNELQKSKKICKQKNINFNKLLRKTKNHLKNLTKQAKTLGFDIDFESFLNLLEKYIEIKDNLSTNEKKQYLNLLVNLSNIYDINLKEELEKYVSYYKPTSKDKLAQELCLYYLENKSPEEYENIKKDAIANDLDFLTLEEKTKSFLKKLTESVNKLGYSLERETFFKILADYFNKKDNFTDETKIQYLTVLLNLSKIYNINLREQLNQNIKNNKKINSIKSYSNPLDNNQLLKTLLYQRYNNGAFNPSEISIPIAKESEFSEELYDYTIEQTELISKIISIYLDKITNFALDDINPLYKDILNEYDIDYLKNISIDNLQDYVYKIKEYQELTIPQNVTKFIKILISATEYTSKIGSGEYNVFKSSNSNQEYSIFINTPNTKETFEFLNEYIKECIVANLNYDMLGFSYDQTSKHRTIIYSSQKDLPTKLAILNNLTHLTNSFGTPFKLASSINNSYYTLAYNPSKDLDYIEYISSLLEVSYYRILTKILINQNIEPKDLTILKSFLLLKNVTITEDKNPLNYLYNKNKFSIIKDIINKNIPNILNTLNLYMSQDNYTDKLVIELKKSLIYLSNLTYFKDKNSKTILSLPNLN